MLQTSLNCLRKCAIILGHKTHSLWRVVSDLPTWGFMKNCWKHCLAINCLYLTLCKCKVVPRGMSIGTIDLSLRRVRYLPTVSSCVLLKRCAQKYNKKPSPVDFPFRLRQDTFERQTFQIFWEKIFLSTFSLCVCVCAVADPGALGARAPLAPRFKSCSFETILREKAPYFEQILGPPWGQNSTGPPWPKSWIRAWCVCVCAHAFCVCVIFPLFAVLHNGRCCVRLELSFEPWKEGFDTPIYVLIPWFISNAGSIMIGLYLISGKFLQT